MEGAHLSISAFGGTFLMMVALSYFMDEEKEVDPVKALESRLRDWSGIRGIEVALVLAVAVGVTVSLPASQGVAVLFAPVCGLLTFLYL